MPDSLASSSRYTAALEFLLGRIDYERTAAPAARRGDRRLERMHNLLARLDDPHHQLPIVHVAGTKGKGSTAAMIAAMLTAAGYRTGLYTSPHLERLEERVAIDGQPCTPEQLVALVERVRPAVEQFERDLAGADPLGGATYFEITTALALLHFVAQHVDAAVVEVGLGGRLDSTNVVRPRLSVITSISFDHMKQLGSTLAEIAREKAGIIKPGVPVVSGVLNAEARRAIEEVRRRQSAPLVQLGEDFNYRYRPPRDVDAAAASGEMDFETRGLSPFAESAEQMGTAPFAADSSWSFRKLRLALLGRHQAANASVALAAVNELRRQGWIVSEAAVRQGLEEVRWPARVEVLARRPTVVLDAAHNLASIASLLETLDESFATRRRLLIFATTLDKQVREMLELLVPRFERVLLTRYTNNPRGVPVEELDRLAGGIADVPREHFATPAEAWRRARELATPEHLVCIAGSFFLAAELRPLIAGK